MQVCVAHHNLDVPNLLIQTTQEAVQSISIDVRRQLSGEFQSLLESDGPDLVTRTITQRASGNTSSNPAIIGLFKSMRQALNSGMPGDQMLVIVKGILDNA